MVFPAWTAPGQVDNPGLSFEHRRQSMSAQRFTPKFKEEAVRQITEKGLSFAEVAVRLGCLHIACINGGGPYLQTGASSIPKSCLKPRARSCVCAVRCGISKKNGIYKKKLDGTWPGSPSGSTNSSTSAAACMPQPDVQIAASGSCKVLCVAA